MGMLSGFVDDAGMSGREGRTVWKSQPCHPAPDRSRIMSGNTAIARRRLMAWLLIVQQLCVGAGMALPCSAAAAGQGERYPCEHCGCGCGSAEQCWARCCCLTHREKVLWAERHGVAVPEFVAAAARDEESIAGQAPKCTHCHARGAAQAAAKAQGRRSGNDRQAGKDEDRRSGGICWLSALRCHGLHELGQAAVPTWTVERQATLRVVLLPADGVEPPSFLSIPFSPPAPPTPPPKEA